MKKERGNKEERKRNILPVGKIWFSVGVGDGCGFVWLLSFACINWSEGEVVG